MMDLFFFFFVFFIKKLEAENAKIVKQQTKLENEDVKLRANKEHVSNRKEKGKLSIEAVI